MSVTTEISSNDLDAIAKDWMAGKDSPRFPSPTGRASDMEFAHVSDSNMAATTDCGPAGTYPVMCGC